MPGNCLKWGSILLETCPTTFVRLIRHYVTLPVFVRPNAINNYNIKLHQKPFKIAVTINVQVSPLCFIVTCTSNSKSSIKLQ